jgi:tRNA pseudouridine38-40 synthase
LLLELRFDGEAYHGWQVQPNGLTVQEVLQNALEQVLGRREGVTGCSRTDAGVHARQFFCHLRTDHPISPARLAAALNHFLPPSAAVLSCREVPADFHARYSCRGKTYRYHIRNAAVRDPFLVGRCLLWPYPLPADLLHDAAQDFLGAHDFSAFCAAGSSADSKIRTVTRAEVRREGDDVFFFAAADGFLYHMVRIMAGTLLELAKTPDRCVPGRIAQILASQDRTQAGPTAPPAGLCLWEVRYGGDAWPKECS